MTLIVFRCNKTAFIAYRDLAVSYTATALTFESVRIDEAFSMIDLVNLGARWTD